MAQGGGGLMVSVSGIRGRVGEALTPGGRRALRGRRSARGRIAQGGSRQIVVGRDSRVSGPMFHRVVLSAAAVGRLRRHRHRAHDDADAASSRSSTITRRAA